MANVAVTNTLANGAVVDATQLNTNYTDITGWLNNRNTAATSWDALKMGGNKITSLGNGTASTDAAAFGQVHMPSIPVFASETTGGSSTSTSFADKGATVSITPSSVSSKIAVWAVAPANGSAANTVTILGVSMAGTDLVTTTTSPCRSQGTTIQSLTFFYLSSPASTSSITYTVRMANNGTGTSNIGGSAATGAATQIMVWEVI